MTNRDNTVCLYYSRRFDKIDEYINNFIDLDTDKNRNLSVTLKKSKIGKHEYDVSEASLGLIKNNPYYNKIKNNKLQLENKIKKLNTDLEKIAGTDGNIDIYEWLIFNWSINMNKNFLTNSEKKRIFKRMYNK